MSLVARSNYFTSLTQFKIMGIDIYARWKEQTENEAKAQMTGFSAVHGHVGYLREAYHGEPYATTFLVKEAFDAESREAKIPASVLRARLPRTIELARERAIKVYGETGEIARARVKSFVDFVELCEEKERKTGEAVTIVASY
jgi:hypothetical protein